MVCRLSSNLLHSAQDMAAQPQYQQLCLVPLHCSMGAMFRALRRVHLEQQHLEANKETAVRNARGPW